MSSYFNDNDAYAAAWLRNLYPAATVDDRSIVDVQPDDLVGYQHCAFFAGVGAWQYALDLAGWPADREVWTGSAPCQPFSAAGKRGGTADARHLWPEFFRLIRARRPECVLGEQVNGQAGYQWLAGIRDDLAEIGYQFGAVDLPACSVGAPHIRQRLFWVAHRVADTGRPERTGRGQSNSGPGLSLHAANGGGTGRLGDSRQSRLAGRTGLTGDDGAQQPAAQRAGGDAGPWSDAILIPCADGRSRRAQSGVQCLVDGVAFQLADGRTRTDVSRAALLRVIGNSISPQVAAAFIRAFLDCEAG